MQFDFVIVGAGILGLSLARELNARHPAATIAILEKEHDIGLHASGRNSGILHAGIYYPSGSLKASLCLEGARAMAAYCDEYQLPIKRIGKIIVPGRKEDDATLDMLCKRATSNGANVRLLAEDELRELEPEASVATGRALFSPETAVVDPLQILAQIKTELMQRKVLFYFNHSVNQLDVSRRMLHVGQLKLSYGHLFNTAGLYADKLAKASGLLDGYTMIPFKGMYYELKPQSMLKVNHLIYPVPDMNVPFLGVHVTKSVGGKIYLGPTAVPVLGREHYTGLAGIRLLESLSTFYTLGGHYLKNKQGFRTYAHQEIPRFLKARFLASAKLLVPRIKGEDLVRSAKVGIRAQLFDKTNKSLAMDFIVRHTAHETHILNAVSPAFTSAFSFSKYVLDAGKFA